MKPLSQIKPENITPNMKVKNDQNEIGHVVTINKARGSQKHLVMIDYENNLGAQVFWHDQMNSIYYAE